MTDRHGPHGTHALCDQTLANRDATIARLEKERDELRAELERQAQTVAMLCRHRDEALRLAETTEAEVERLRRERFSKEEVDQWEKRHLDRATRAEAALAEAVAFLCEEADEYGCGQCANICTDPNCKYSHSRDGHHPDCAIAALLAAHPTVPK